MKRHPRSICFRAALVFLGLAASAQAQVGQSVSIVNSIPVTNALGWKLPGCFCSPEAASRVEIREVGSAIQPPDPETGAGHPNNPLVRVSHMGVNVIGVDPGRFSEVFTNRLDLEGKTYFARVFDAPTTDRALYYANSAPFQDVPPELRPTVSSINILFQPLRLVNGEEDLDSDGDGIPDAMENNMEGLWGLDPGNRDTDGDGWSDYFEVVHGAPLNATEPNPIDLLLEAAAPPTVSWWTIPGLTYRLGYYDQAETPHEWSEVWSGTATETNLVVDVENVVLDPKGFFRVWAVPDNP